jgi:MFS family permease
VIRRRVVLSLGLAQLVSWGVTYYVVGVFGDLIAEELRWSRALVHGGYSLALLAMGIASPIAGRLIDRHGGRRVMAAGSVLAAAGCAGLALAHSVVVYYAAWGLLGIAMRCTLYDAAFATLARIGGPAASRSMSQITLLGGLASSAFWPIGQLLAGALGWRGAVIVYAGLALLTLPLHLALPQQRYREPAKRSPPATVAGDRLIAGGLYAMIVALTGVLSSGMSAHMIGILVGLGLAAPVAVWVAALRGVAQSVARLADVLLGGRVHPLNLNLFATLLLVVCFAPGPWNGHLMMLAIGFAALYGAGNGLATITRGTVPLVLFGHSGYGGQVGRLLIPSFLLSAAAPLGYAYLLDEFGERPTLWFSALLGAVMLTAAATLRVRYR